MAEPETEGTDIPLRAAEVASDVSETDKPQEQRRVAEQVHQGRDPRRAGGGPRYAGRTAARGRR